MVGFFFKKSFFDGYDNFLKLILFNFLYAAITVGGIWSSFFFFSDRPILLFLCFYLTSFLTAFYSFGVNFFLYKWSCYEKGYLNDCVRQYRGNFKCIVVFSIILFFFLFVIPFTQYLYLSESNPIGFLVTMVLFGFEILFLFVVQFYYPVCYYSELSAKSVINICLAYSFDNIPYSLILAIRSVFDLALTVVSLGIIPGIGGIGLSGMTMVRLLTERYQFLEKNESLSKKDADWNTILASDKVSTGKRTLRNMIFPWKD